MENRKRNVNLHVMVKPDELAGRGGPFRYRGLYVEDGSEWVYPTR